MRKSLFVLGVALTALMSLIVINAQHQDAVQPEAIESPSTAMFVQTLCTEHGTATDAAGTHHVPTEIASALELTDAQQTELDGKITNACATIARLHEDMMGVLTPEQLEKMRALHSTHTGVHDATGAAGIHTAVMSWLKKLHGVQ